jgi:hypothetical protein
MAGESVRLVYKYAPGGIRTHGLRFERAVLYGLGPWNLCLSAELRGQCGRPASNRDVREHGELKTRCVYQFRHGREWEAARVRQSGPWPFPLQTAVVWPDLKTAMQGGDDFPKIVVPR